MEMSSHEEWKPIEEVKGIYSVSNQGRVMNNRTGYILKSVPYNKGYMKVNLKIDGKSISRQVHRLVAMAFIPNPYNKPEVNHKNGMHEDNRVENLEWVTGEENRKHAYETGLIRHKDYRYSGYLYNIWRKNHRENMCSEWQDYLTFYDWCYEQGYTDDMFIALKDYTKRYDPYNCIISATKNHPSKLYSCNGEELSMKEITKKYGVTEGCIKYRIHNKGMDLKEAISMKKGKAKDNCLKIRLNKTFYEHLFRESEKRQITVSAYVRELIDKDIKEQNKGFQKELYT